MGSNESRTAVGVRMHDLLSAKHITKIATRNVRTAYASGRLAQIIRDEIQQHRYPRDVGYEMAGIWTVH